MFGYERLLTLVESLAALPAKEIAEKLFQQVQEFSGNRPQDDDQTLIVLKRVTK
jgi:serine phosphatase RsbU (regulator of sigma subunit)